jgi:hypothetical protein
MRETMNNKKVSFRDLNWSAVVFHSTIAISFFLASAFLKIIYPACSPFIFLSPFIYLIIVTGIIKTAQKDKSIAGSGKKNK